MGWGVGVLGRDGGDAAARKTEDNIRMFIDEELKIV